MVQIEEPIPIFMVRLDLLRKYKHGENPANLLEETNEIRFPLSVDGQVRSSITLRQIKGRWEVTRIGSPQITKRLSEVIQSPDPDSKDTRSSREEFFQVRIPALSLDFVGHREGRRIVLTSLVTEPLYELQAGETLDAGKVFERLVPFAQQLDTGPRIAE